MKRLRTKFLVFILLPVIVVLVGTGVLSFFIARHVVIQQLWSIGTLSLHQAADEIDSGLAMGTQVLRIMALQEGLPGSAIADPQAFLQRLQQNFPIEAPFFALADGRYIVGDDKAQLPAGYDHRLSKWYEAALDSDAPIVSAPYMSLFSSNMIITVACKVIDGEGHLKGVVGYNIPLTAIRQRMPSIMALEEFPGAVFSIFMRDGRYILHSDDAKIGRKLGESNEELHVQMSQALMEDKTSWHSIGTIGGSYWYGGFEASRQNGIFVALEIPLMSAVLPTVGVMGAAYVLLGLTSLIALTIILTTIARKISRPVTMLSRAAARLRKGDYSETLPVISKDELGQLVQAFNTLTEGLRQRDFIRDAFGRYLTQEVVDQLLESEHGLKLGGENREISIVMSDLRGFTALTADMPPEQVINFLNRYLETMVEILLDHRAIIDEIEGDGILAFFGAPTPMHDHAVRAVACALEMQKAMEGVNARNQAAGLPRLEMALAVNTGGVVVGNIGSEKRTKYGVVGSEVNFAGRIESFAVGGEVLISHATYEKVRDAVIIGDVIRVEMKGIPEPVRLYSVRGIEGPFNVELPEALHEPARIEQKIPLRLSRVDDNVVTPIPGVSWLTHVGEGAAVVLSNEMMIPREEIRLDVLDDRRVKSLGEGFAKVVSVRETNSGVEALVRFSFVSPGLRRLFRRALKPGA